MKESAVNSRESFRNWRRFAHCLMTIGENRFALLKVEIQEVRLHLLQALLMALGVAASALLAILTLTAAIVIGLWNWSPVAVLLILTGLYGGAGIYLYRRLARLLRDSQMLSATRDQFQKDRALMRAALA